MYTHDWSDEADNALGDLLVTSVFVVTAIFPAIAAIIALKLKVGGGAVSRPPPPALSRNSRSRSTTYQELRSSNSSIEQSSWEDSSFASRDQQDTATYHDTTGMMPRFDHTTSTSSQRHFSINQDLELQEANDHDIATSIWEGKYSDITCMVLFQIILIMIGLRTPVTSLIGDAAWNAIVVTMISSVILIISRSFFPACQLADSSATTRQSQVIVQSHNRCTTSTNISTPGELENNEQFVDNPLTTSAAAEMNAKTHLFRIKRVAIYLILRHSIPGSGPILYSYIYELFRSNPLYLQLMSTLNSSMAVASTKFFEKSLASRFSSVFGIAFMIAILTTLGSLWSLLYIPFFHKVKTTTTEDGVVTVTADWSIWLMVLFSLYQVLGNFVGELSFMPSIILATNTLAQAPTEGDSAKHKQSNNNLDRRQIGSSHDHIFEFDDGIQYGLFVSCIDFGDQLSDWFSIPIV